MKAMVEALPGFGSITVGKYRLLRGNVHSAAKHRTEKELKIVQAEVDDGAGVPGQEVTTKHKHIVINTSV